MKIRKYFIILKYNTVKKKFLSLKDHLETTVTLHTFAKFYACSYHVHIYSSTFLNELDPIKKHFMHFC